MIQFLTGDFTQDASGTIVVFSMTADQRGISDSASSLGKTVTDLADKTGEALGNAAEDAGEFLENAGDAVSDFWNGLWGN